MKTLLSHLVAKAVDAGPSTQKYINKLEGKTYYQSNIARFYISKG